MFGTWKSEDLKSYTVRCFPLLSEIQKGASTLRFCAFSVDEDKVRGYLRDLEGICQTKVAMNLSRLLKTIDARGTVQGLTKKQE